jgi:hypothetical protein
MTQHSSPMSYDSAYSRCLLFYCPKSLFPGAKKMGCSWHIVEFFFWLSFWSNQSMSAMLTLQWLWGPLGICIFGLSVRPTWSSGVPVTFSANLPFSLFCYQNPSFPGKNHLPLSRFECEMSAMS